MRYQHKDLTIELDNSKGRVYRDGKNMFRGDGYISIKMLCYRTDNATRSYKKI